MAVAFFDSEFRLVRGLDEIMLRSISVDGSKADVDSFVFVTQPPRITFTPDLVTISSTKFFTVSTTNQYSGIFEQADDGTISGTVTGVSGYHHDIVTRSAANEIAASFLIVDDSHPHIATTFTSELVPELLFNVSGLNIDFEELNQARETLSNVDLAAGLILEGNDQLYRSETPGRFVIDNLRGYDGDDQISGSGSIDDILLGDGGNDSLSGLGGDDSLNGGEGADVAVYQGSSGSYTIDLFGGSFGLFSESGFLLRVLEGFGNSLVGHTITDRVADRDGTDTFINVDQLYFRDQTLDLDILSIPFSPTHNQITELASLYTAYFDRAPDALGLYFWAAQVGDGMGLEEVSGLFTQSSEALNTSMFYESSELFVTSVYANVLNRVPDAKGVAFWTSMLENGFVTRGTVILDVIRGAQVSPAEGESAELQAQREADVAYLEDTSNLGLYFAAEKGMSDVDNARAVFDLFDGSAESLATSKAVVDTFYAEALDPITGELLVKLTGVLDDPFFM